MGGEFKTTQTYEENEQKNGKKINKLEVETLLKKGILGLVDEDDKETQSYFEGDIDQILQKNSRVANYSVINGAYTISKS